MMPIPLVSDAVVHAILNVQQALRQFFSVLHPKNI